jgi:hypothetical protein
MAAKTFDEWLALHPDYIGSYVVALLHDGWDAAIASMEAQPPAPNNARDAICRCEHRDGWVAFRDSWVLLTVIYCPSCGGKLSPVA